MEEPIYLILQTGHQLHIGVSSSTS
jgi:hypothetical protein